MKTPIEILTELLERIDERYGQAPPGENATEEIDRADLEELVAAAFPEGADDEE